MIPEPWALPPIRAPLEMEASLFDSDVQGLLGTEELVGNELTSNLARIFTQWLGADWIWGRRGATSTCLSQVHCEELHVLQIIARCFFFCRNCCRLEIVWDVPGKSIRFSSDVRIPHIPSLRTVAWDRCSGVEERCALSPPWSAEVE